MGENTYLGRRLPIYLVIDCSAQMAGKPIEAVRQGISALVSELRGNPVALEIAYLSVISFADSASLLCPLIDLMTFEEPVVPSPSGTSSMGNALRLLRQSIDKEVRFSTPTRKGDHRPCVFIMTNDSPCSDWEGIERELMGLRAGGVVACAAGPDANRSVLAKFADIVIDLGDYEQLYATVGRLFRFDEAEDSLPLREILRRSLSPPQTQIVPLSAAGAEVADSPASDGRDRKDLGVVPMTEFPGPRRQPVYLLLDCSGSMSGEPIEACRQGIRALVSDLLVDPFMVESAYLSVITFASTAQQVCPLIELIAFQEPNLTAGGATSLGEALRVLKQCVDAEVRKATPTRKGDWKPVVFLLIGSQPTDSWETTADQCKQEKIANIMVCVAGPAANKFKRLTETVVELNNLQPAILMLMFRWSDGPVETISQVAADPPPPRPEIEIVP